MKRFLAWIVVLLVCFSTVAAPVDTGIYVERSIKGVSIFADTKWKIDDQSITIKDQKTGSYVAYPYMYTDEYIYLMNPTHVDSNAPLLHDRVIEYISDGRKINLYFDDNTCLKLINQDDKTKWVRAGGDVLVLVGSIATAHGVTSTVNSYNATKAAQAAAVETMEKTASLGVKPSTTYVDNGFEYVVDELGRPISAKGHLDVANMVTRRDSEMTRAVGKIAGVSTDQGGHLIADSMGGPSTGYNLVPMDGVLNNGKFKSLEMRLARLARNGSNVDLEVIPVYEGNGIRPSKIIYNTLVDGISRIETFINPIPGV